MRSLLSVLFSSILFLGLQAQMLEPVKWTWSIEETDKSDVFILKYEATIEEGWKVYSQYLESDDGPVRTSFNYDTKDGYKLKGKNEESGNKKEGYDKMFDMNLIAFKSPKATFTQKIKIIDPIKEIVGYFEFMTCDDTQCLPPTAVDFTFKIPELKNSTGDAEKTTIPKSENAVVEKVIPKTKLSNPPGKPPVDLPKKPSRPGVEQGNIASFDEGDPVSWRLKARRVAPNELELVYTAVVEKGWYLYSQFTSDEGPIPTAFVLEENAAHEMMGKAKEIGKIKEAKDPLFDNLLVKKFVSSPVEFVQRIKINGDEPILGFIEYMTCDEKQCMFPTPIDFKVDPESLEVLLGAEANPIAENGAGLNIIGDVSGTNESEKVVTEGRVMDGNVIDQKVLSLYETQQEPLSDCGVDETTKDSNLLWTFIIGFLGGLVALLTPCVFPMIPLTVSYFTKGSKDRASGIRNGLIYGLSIIVIYVAIGLLITGVFGATALNELSTNWVANVLFFLIFIVFAISFFGYFEITLPSSWTTATDRMADGGGLIGTFFMAFTLALVSFSCTGPIIGSALVQSATDSLGPFTVMLGFSSALALPFGLFAAFPALLNSLPQSGGWMNSVKVVLGFLELALALKFLSVADMTMHWGFLRYELFMGLWVIIFAAMALYIFGYIKFPHDSPLKKLSRFRMVFGVLVAAFTIYLATGFKINKETGVYNSLSLMSGLAPPATYNFFLTDQKADEEINAKYASYSKCANNLDCFKDYFEALAYAEETNKPIFIDFTGHGCVNCRKTEEHIWINPEVTRMLKDEFILVSLYVDDRKNLDETLVSKTTEKKIRNIGNLWADFQITNFEQNSQPLYVMVSPDQKVIANPRGYKDGTEDYIRFMSCGLEYYNENLKK